MKVKLPAVISTDAPTSSDDKTKGYTVGTLWFRPSTSTLYIASDVDTGAATWTEVGSGGGGGSGTVTEVGITDSTGILDITGSPVTTDGDIDIDLDNQDAHKVLVGPNTGSPAKPTFRILTNEDIVSALVDALDAGDNVTIEDNEDGTITISSSGGGGGGGPEYDLEIEVDVTDINVEPGNGELYKKVADLPAGHSVIYSYGFSTTPWATSLGVTSIDFELGTPSIANKFMSALNSGNAALGSGKLVTTLNCESRSSDTDIKLHVSYYSANFADLTAGVLKIILRCRDFSSI